METQAVGEQGQTQVQNMVKKRLGWSGGINKATSGPDPDFFLPQGQVQTQIKLCVIQHSVIYCLCLEETFVKFCWCIFAMNQLCCDLNFS